MAYEPKEWKCGDPITYKDMNRIEEGVAQMSSGGYPSPMIVSFSHEDSDGTFYMDKTYREVADAIIGGRTVLLDVASTPTSSYDIYMALLSDVSEGDSLTISGLKADSPDGYLYAENER